MRTRIALCLASLSIAALSAAGCGTSTFQGQVVSCADKRPIPDAKLTYAEPNGEPMPKRLVSEMPGVTSQDGTVKAEMLDSKGTTYEMTIQKDGYASKTVPLTSGRDQNICLDPAAKQ
jgi:hypothetical protein